MTAKRAAAVVVAAMMIIGAWFVRNRVLDDDAGAGPGTLVCVSDLTAVCRTVSRSLGVDIRIESADETLATLGSAAAVEDEVWITMAPFPEMVDSLRSNARLDPRDAEDERVASSPLTLVAKALAADDMTADDITADDIAAMCGTPVDWACLGTDTTATVGFAPFPHTAIGQLGVTAAVVGVGGGSVPTSGDPTFTLWARRISADSSNGAGDVTALTTIQTRPSRFDVAVGAEAELVDPADPRFVLLAPSSTTPVEVVVSTPAGTEPPSRLIDALRDELAAAGWSPAGTARTEVSAGDMLAVREIWKDFS